MQAEGSGMIAGAFESCVGVYVYERRVYVCMSVLYLRTRLEQRLDDVHLTAATQQPQPE